MKALDWCKSLVVTCIIVLGCLAQGAWANTATEIANIINTATAGNNLTVSVSGNTVTVTGTLGITPSTNNFLTFGINSDVTVVWRASLSGNPNSNFALINITGGTGTFRMESGTIANTGTGRAITNSSTSAINIQGGTVSSASGVAIHNASTGVITISGSTTRITSANASSSSGTIVLANSGTEFVDRLIINSGTVENTVNSGNAIYNNSVGTVRVAGGTVSATTGSAIRLVSIGMTPPGGTFGSYSGSVNISNGTVSTGTGTTISGGERTVTGGGLTISGGTVSTTTGTAISTGKSSGFTISGGTVSATTGRAINYSGNGTVTISGSATRVASANTSNTNGTIQFSGGNGGATLTITGGTVENTATGTSGGHTIYMDEWRSNTVNVSGGTVRSVSGDAIHNRNLSGSNLSVNISGSGTVTASGSNRRAVYVEIGSVRITGGTVSATQSSGWAVYTNSSVTTTLGGNPTITGRIYTHADMLSVLTTGASAFAPATDRVYALEFPSYPIGRVAVMNASNFLRNFVLQSSEWALTVAGAHLAVAQARTVSFDLNGGTGTRPASVSVGHGSTLHTKPPTTGFTRAGFISDGNWYTTSAGTTEFLFGDGGTPVMGNMTLWLRWVVVPTAPQNFTATAGNAEVSLSWTAPTNSGSSAIIEYQVSNDDGTSWVTASNNTAHTFTDLINGTSYTFWIRAVNAIGNGVEVFRIATPTLPTPNAPRNFSATAGNTWVSLSWTAPVDNGGSAIIEYQVSSDDGTSWITASSNTAHTFTDLTNGTSYTFRVRAVNIAGNGAEASVVATPNFTPPTAPQNFVAAVGLGRVSLNWTAPVDNGGSAITGYEVSSNGTSWVTASSNTVHIFTGLTNGISYTFRVRAVNAIGIGAEATTIATPRDPVVDFYQRIAAATSNVEVVVGQDITLNEPVIIPGGRTITIRSVNPTVPVTLMRGTNVTGSLFSVQSTTLILENIIIDGANIYESLIVIESNGTLIMNDGAVVRNCGWLSAILGGGQFTMNGGKISNNARDGVSVRGWRGFTMNGGEISGNARDGVSVGGTFTMNGGEISGNAGDGVSAIGNSGQITMNGGKINDNASSGVNLGGLGGGEYIRFNMNGGEINGNTSDGVFVGSSFSVFTMDGGEISSNGNNGVSLDGPFNWEFLAIMTMNGGKINSNASRGVNLGSRATRFDMNGGEIVDNNGGVRVANGIFGGNTRATFNMTGGKISGNITNDVGGGVAVMNQCWFTMTGGEISGNTAETGNGVSVSGGTFTMNGGVVAGTGASVADVISSDVAYSFNSDAPNNAIVITWSKPTDTGPFIYDENTSTNLTLRQAGTTATAVWAIESGKFGVSYENGNNSGFIEMIGVTVRPIPTVTNWPTATDITYGDALSTSTLNGGNAIGVDGESITGSFTWTSDATIPTAINSGYSVTFTPSDSYAPVTKNDVVVTVIPKPLTVTADNKTVIYGDAIPAYTVSYSGFVSGQTSSVLNGTLAFTCEYTTNSNIGTYDIIPNGLTSTNYAITFVNGILTVGRKSIATPIAATNLVYSGSAQTGVSSGTGYTLSGTYTATDAGDYTAIVAPDGNHQWNSGNDVTEARDINWNIDKRAITGATVTVNGIYAYTGSEQTPSAENVSVTLTGFNPTYSIAATNNINAGTATVTVTGMGNFTGTATRTFTIYRKILTADMLSIPAVTFNGFSQTPVLTVIDGTETLVRNTDYTTTTLTSQTNAGTYAVTVTGTGNYTGTSSVNFVINRKPLTEEMLFVPAVAFNGAAQIPVLTVTDYDIGPLTRNINYTVSLTPQINIGTYPITVTGMGNYTGTPSVNFVINNNAISVLSPERVIPPSTLPNQEDNNSFSNVLTSEFTVGPNPINRNSGNVNFFRQGKRIESATLIIHDASGNVVNKIRITDNAIGTQERREVGSWDLTDGRGRMVAEGTYLVRGVVVTTDGKKERVSVMLGIR